MEKRRDGWYNADKGKHFVLTEKGKKEVASYHHKTVGEPVREYDTEAVGWAVESGYVIEVDIPNWVVKPGFRVVYDYKGHILSAGNPIVFPERELAENYLTNWQKKYDADRYYIADAVYEGVALTDCRVCEGKRVYNNSWYYGIDALCVGDYVEPEVVNMLLDMLSPACMRSDCSQVGEPANHVSDKDGKLRATYSTFKQIADSIWEYCGECFCGENVPPIN